MKNQNIRNNQKKIKSVGAGLGPAQPKRDTQKAITLVALIITIIVLLVLATVSISLIMNSGIIDKANEGVEKYSEEEIEEQIKLACNEYVIVKFGKTDKTIVGLIQERLEKIYDDVTVKPKSENEIYPVTVKVKKYVYDINDDLSVVGPIDYKELESLYGKVVRGYTGYSATNVTEWKLLYVDEQYNEAFIISSNSVSLGPPIPLISINGLEYTGSNNVANFEYGRKYNRKWLEKCNEESTEVNAKAVAYLCDPDNWNQYVTGKAKYAAGGPTIEIFAAVGKGIQVRDIKINKVNKIGYPTNWEAGIVTETFNKNLLNVGGAYWFASPSTYNNYIHYCNEGGYYHYTYGRKS